MPSVTITERGDRRTSGELLYLYTYPRAITDESWRVLRFEERAQRVGIKTLDGRTLHFTVPAGVE